MNSSEKDSYYMLIGNVNSLNYDTVDNTDNYLLLIPLRFWFCKDVDSLPELLRSIFNQLNLFA